MSIVDAAPQGATLVTEHQTLLTIIGAAHAAGASDVTMFRPDSGPMNVRAKIDGVWRQLQDVSEQDARVISNSTKSGIAGMSTGDTALVQEGALTIEGNVGPLLLRLAIFPAANGEKITVRLPPAGAVLSLDELSIGEQNLAAIKGLLEQPNGLISVVGPVGSGKTVLLYGSLLYLAGPEKSVSTVEDPPERVLPGVTHMAINEKAGATYEHFMKSLLRGSDDLVLLGEIRDRVTGSSAVQIGKAGTLVLTTLHASDNLQALARLTEFSGQSMSSVLDTARGFISQRLLRRTCTVCGGNRCEFCHQTGYSGRVPIHEVLVVDDELRIAAAEQAPMHQLLELSRRRGLPTLEQDAKRLLGLNITDQREIRRVLGHDAH